MAQGIRSITEYENFEIEEASVQFINANGTTENATAFGCIGSLTVEPEIEEIVKNCGRTQIAATSKTKYLNVTIEAHLKVGVAEQIFGLDNTGLKEGVYGLSVSAVKKDFIFTAVVYDMTRNVKKLIAFPLVSNVSGFSLNLDNSATEVQTMSLDFRAMKDSNNMFYYEAYESEITDNDVKTQWLTNFNPELVLVDEG